MFITLWDIKELTHYSQRVGHGVPGVVVCFSVTYYGLEGQSLRDITFSKLLLNSRVHSAHAIHQLANEERECKNSSHCYNPQIQHTTKNKESMTHKTKLHIIAYSDDLNNISKSNFRSQRKSMGNDRFIYKGREKKNFTNSV